MQVKANTVILFLTTLTTLYICWFKETLLSTGLTGIVLVARNKEVTLQKSFTLSLNSLYTQTKDVGNL
jgi:hypothetical protein